MTTSRNPYNVCTWQPAEACAECGLDQNLVCRFDRRHLVRFVGSFGGFAIPAVIGVILGGYPFPFLALGQQFLWAGVALWGLAVFFYSLRAFTCTRCVNLSCPLNRAPSAVAQAHLARHPGMPRAWSEHGGSSQGTPAGGQDRDGAS